MIQHKFFYRKLTTATRWVGGRRLSSTIKCRCEGWYLFGLIRLYSRQLEYPKEIQCDKLELAKVGLLDEASEKSWKGEL